MQYKINENKLNEKVFYTERKYSTYFFIYDEEQKDVKFSAFRIEEFEEGEKKGIVIEVKAAHTEVAKMIFSNYHGDDIYSYIGKYQDFFKKNNEWIDILKLRGDFAELLFLKEIGGTKLDDSQVYDIKFGEDYIEVKSYSGQNKRVTISNEQLGNESIKAVVEIKLDPEGIDILSFSKLIPFNETFKRYIEDAYSLDIYKDYKFSIKKPQRWESPMKLKLDEPIVSGKFKVNVLDNDLSEFE